LKRGRKQQTTITITDSRPEESILNYAFRGLKDGVRLKWPPWPTPHAPALPISAPERLPAAPAVSAPLGRPPARRPGASPARQHSAGRNKPKAFPPANGRLPPGFQIESSPTLDYAGSWPLPPFAHAPLLPSLPRSIAPRNSAHLPARSFAPDGPWHQALHPR